MVDHGEGAARSSEEQDNFSRTFGLNEPLLDYNVCSLVSGQSRRNGVLYLTNNHLCFRIDNEATLLLSLRDVVAVERAHGTHLLDGDLIRVATRQRAWLFGPSSRREKLYSLIHSVRGFANPF